jgi:hypothetical protein
MVAREFDEVAFEQPAFGHAQDRRTGAQTATLADLLDEASALERAEQARRRALGDARRGGDLGEGDGLGRFEDAQEQVSAAVDRRGTPSVCLELLFHAWIYYGRPPHLQPSI